LKKDSNVLYRQIFKPLLFRMDSERAHSLGFFALKGASGVPGIPYLLQKEWAVKEPRLQVKIWGKTFANPVGLAAGFDKNARLVSAWQNLGFGFCEVGTITARPQSGNPKPRVFRLPEDFALINRLGFNNLGAQAISRHLEKVFFQKSPENSPGNKYRQIKGYPLESGARRLFLLFATPL